MTRLVIMVALVSLLATAATAEAMDIRPGFVDECRDYADHPLSNPARTECRMAISDLPDDARRDGESTLEEVMDLGIWQILP